MVLSIIPVTFADPVQRARAVSLYAAAIGLGMMVLVAVLLRRVTDP